MGGCLVYADPAAGVLDDMVYTPPWRGEGDVVRCSSSESWPLGVDWIKRRIRGGVQMKRMSRPPPLLREGPWNLVMSGP
jgi:hypothetical protein